MHYLMELLMNICSQIVATTRSGTIGQRTADLILPMLVSGCCKSCLYSSLNLGSLTIIGISLGRRLKRSEMLRLEATFDILWDGNGMITRRLVFL